MEEKQHSLPPTQELLESLTVFDLAKLAEDEGIDVPLGLDRVFIIEELLEIYSEENAGSDEDEVQDFVPKKAHAKDEMLDIVIEEAAPLPKHYNITFVNVMIRDPFWVFVFWEVKSQEKEYYEGEENFKGYYLKVSPLQNSAKNADGIENKTKVSFTIPVGNEDSAWYLNLNSEKDASSVLNGSGCCKIDLCANLGGEEAVLASSAPIKLPGESNGRKIPEQPNPLCILSGSECFQVLRKSERNFRQKKNGHSDSA